MISDFFRKYGIPTYSERKAQVIKNLESRVMAYRNGTTAKERIKYRSVNKEQVFAILCLADKLPGGLHDPGIRSVHDIARELGASEYQIRKCVRELVNDGMVEAAHFGGLNGDGKPYCYHGFCVTKTATKTEVYQDADKAMMEEFSAMCEPMKER